jgi:hypothetical protein
MFGPPPATQLYSNASPGPRCNVCRIPSINRQLHLPEGLMLCNALAHPAKLLPHVSFFLLHSPFCIQVSQRHDARIIALGPYPGPEGGATFQFCTEVTLLPVHDVTVLCRIRLGAIKSAAAKGYFNFLPVFLSLTDR